MFGSGMFGSGITLETYDCYCHEYLLLRNYSVPPTSCSAYLFYLSQNYDNFRKCVENSKCENLSPAKCFGSPLNYKQTAIGSFVPSSQSSSVEEVVEWGAATQQEAHEKLERWAKYLRHFPACWKKVQPFLCAMYLPPCVNDTVQVTKLFMAAHKLLWAAIMRVSEF